MQSRWRRFFDWPMCPPVRERCGSLVFWINWAVAKCCGRTWCDPRLWWVQPVYVLTTPVLGLLALYTATTRSRWWVWAIPLYFVAELALFIVRWLFWDRGPLISARRSLFCFLLNGVGVTVFFAAAFTAMGCIRDVVTIPTALYNSFRTFTTMGPLNIREECLRCEVLVVSESMMAYLLTVAVIGAVASLIVAERL